MADSSGRDELVERLRKHVDILAGLIGERNAGHPRGLDASRAYLRRTVGEAGATAVEVGFATPMRPAANIEVTLPGTDSALPALVVGAHYDTAPGTPGADDNASAVATLLEIVRACGGPGGAGAPPLRRTLMCVFYDCEEPPHFSTDWMGSHQHASRLRAEGRGGRELLGMICLESIGYFPRGVDGRRLRRPWIIKFNDWLFGGRNVVLVSNFRSIPFGLRVAALFAMSRGIAFVPAAMPGASGIHALSDHRAYWEHGYRAMMVTNTAPFRNPNYHGRSDLPATLDYQHMGRLTAGLIKTVWRLCR